MRPGSYLDGPGNKAEPGYTGGTSCDEPRQGCIPGVPQGVGTWTFTKPLPHDAHLAGVPRITVNVEQSAPRVHLIALLYDIDERNRAAFIQRGAYASTRSGSVSFDLFPEDWRLRRGHRLGLLLAGSDEGTLESGPSGSRVLVKGGELSLPLLACERARFLDGGPSEIIKERQTFSVDPSGTTVDWRFPPRLLRGCEPAPRCLPRRLAVNRRGIGPARLGRRYGAFARRYPPVKRGRRANRFCVEGGGRFYVGRRRGRIDFVATTARGHRTRRHRPGRRIKAGRIAGTRRIAPGVLIGHRKGRGRVVYGVRRGRLRFLAVSSRRVAHGDRLLLRLRSVRLVSTQPRRR